MNFHAGAFAQRKVDCPRNQLELCQRLNRRFLAFCRPHANLGLPNVGRDAVDHAHTIKAMALWERQEKLKWSDARVYAKYEVKARVYMRTMDRRPANAMRQLVQDRRRIGEKGLQFLWWVAAIEAAEQYAYELFPRTAA